jgi:hypothetical protein
MQDQEWQDCKILFSPDITKEEAIVLLGRHSSLQRFDTFAEKHQIGSNLVTFGIVTLSLESIRSIQSEKLVVHIETLGTYRTGKPGCDAPPGSSFG